MLAAERIVSLVAALIGPSFNSAAMLQIILPLAFVHCAIDMFVNAGTIGFVVGPKPIVDVSVYMNKLAFTMCSVFSPLPNVLRAIRPGLVTRSISEATLPLASVNRSRFELVWRPFLARLILLVDALRDSFTGFFLRKVF